MESYLKLCIADMVELIISGILPFLLCLKIPTSFFSSIYWSVHLYIHSAAIYLSMHPLPTHLSAVHHSIHLSIHPLINPSFCPSTCLSVHQSIHLHICRSLIPTNSSFSLIQKLATTSAYHTLSQLREPMVKASLLSQLNPRGRTQLSRSTRFEGKWSPEPRNEDQSSGGGDTQMGCGGMSHVLLGIPSF